jgi:hypothetical protein
LDVDLAVAMVPNEGALPLVAIEHVVTLLSSEGAILSERDGGINTVGGKAF